MLVIVALALLGGSLAAWPGSPAIAANRPSSVKVYFFRDGRIAAARRAPVPATGALPDIAVDFLLAGLVPSERAAGLIDALPEGITRAGPVAVDAATGIATVALSAAFLTDDDLERARRMAQVAYTLTHFSNIDSVVFEVDGKTIPALAADGSVLEGAVDRASYESLTPLVYVESPTVWERVAPNFRMWGTANTFEAEFRLRLYDADERILADLVGTATSGSGDRGTFSVRVPYTLAIPGRGTLELSWTDAKTGRQRDIVAIPLQLAASVSSATATAIASPTTTATRTPTIVPILSPTATNPPSTATPSPKPPTATVNLPTATRVPPTATSVPPTPTSAPPTPSPAPPEPPTGYVTLRVFACPSGMTVDTLETSQCALTMGGFDVALTARQTDPPLAGTLSIANAQIVREQFRFKGLPFGTYLFTMTKLPPPFSTFIVPRQTGAEGAPSSGYTFSLTQEDGTFALRVYLLDPEG